MSDELDFWRYRAFRLSQALCSCTWDYDSGTFGETWYELGADTQKIYRTLDLPEHKLGNPDRDKWNPDWVKEQDGSS